jgi:hypothetical protein
MANPANAKPRSSPILPASGTLAVTTVSAGSSELGGWGFSTKVRHPWIFLTPGPLEEFVQRVRGTKD